VLERALAAREVFDLRALDESKLEPPGLDVGELPPDAVILDLRPRESFASWHHPDAVRLDFAHALEAWPSFDRSRSYVLYCDFGLLSAHLAELMRKGGFRAGHVSGGTRALRKRLAGSSR
jgi:thiamine biosynthesis protein ThiI